jgi:hypothetical protein
MYKKITHNVVEEHFAHPLAAQLKKQIDKTKPAPPKNKETLTGPLDLDAHKLFNKLHWGVRNYVVSALGPNDDSTILIKTTLLKDVLEFAPFFNAYYPTTIGSSVVTHLTGFVNSVTDVVQAARSGKDFTSPLTATRGHLDALAGVISAANQTSWPAPTVKAYLHEYLMKVVDQIIARTKKDWKADLEAATLAHNVLTTGPISFGTLKSSPDFACVVVNGIRNQFPIK